MQGEKCAASVNLLTLRAHLQGLRIVLSVKERRAEIILCMVHMVCFYCTKNYCYVFAGAPLMYQRRRGPEVPSGSRQGHCEKTGSRVYTNEAAPSRPIQGQRALYYALLSVYCFKREYALISALIGIVCWFRQTSPAYGSCSSSLLSLKPYKHPRISFLAVPSELFLSARLFRLLLRVGPVHSMEVHDLSFDGMVYNIAPRALNEDTHDHTECDWLTDAVAAPAPLSRPLLVSACQQSWRCVLHLAYHRVIGVFYFILIYNALFRVLHWTVDPPCK